MTRAAKKATITIPIVMTGDGPILLATGLLPAWRVPVGTSLALLSLRRELGGKRLELLKEIIPKLARVAVLGTSSQSGQRTELKEDRTGRSGALGLTFSLGRTESKGY